MGKKGIVSNVILIIACVLFLWPFIWIILTSLKSSAEIYSGSTIFPTKIVPDHYVKVLTQLRDFLSYIRNSVVVTAVSLFMTLLLASLAGYGFARYEFPGSAVFFVVILFVITLPYVVYLIPIFIMAMKFNLLDTNWGLILPYVALNLPLAILIMRGTFRSMPSNLEDAAAIDGCGHVQTWWEVMMPLAKPGLAAAGITSFVGIWGEFMFARTLMASSASQTIPVGVVFLQEEGRSWEFGTLSAVIVLSILPVIVAFIIMQRHFIRGILEGALKG
jgi:ABC-type glycerol-3-phosphate transport system permease component